MKSAKKGDFRSNVSQGSKPQKLELTELEIEESLKNSLSKRRMDCC